MNEFAMHDAAGNGDLEGVRQLIEAGVPVDGLDEQGGTPLHRAARGGQYEVARLLINSECDLDIKDRHGSTPVMLAAGWFKKDIVDLLLHHGAQVNCIDDDGRTLLHKVISLTGWIDIVRLILDKAELNALDHLGCTPLMLAVLTRQKLVIDLLIQSGADINRRNGKNRTVLHEAVWRGLTGIVKILLEKEGLHLSPQDNMGDTPLHFACQSGCQEEAINLLLEAGADPNIKNNAGRSALHEYVRERGILIKKIGLFVQKGAFLENYEYERIYLNRFFKENVLKDVECCTQCVVNKFNLQSLPALNSIAYFAKKLPNVDNFKLGARQIDEVRNLVKREIERNTFCNVVKARPISLSALCVLSLITGQSGKKRAASTGFGHSQI